MSRLRVAAISFLNTVPLMYDFEHEPGRSELADRYEVHYTLPAQCAEELRAGTSDIGIVPVAAYTTISNLRIIPGVAIAAKKAVRSILLVVRGDVRDVKSVAVDTSSRTSVALLRILFERRFKAIPEFVPHKPDLQAMMRNHDAALLIGDPALRVNIKDRTYRYYDLAEEWQHMTGLPFVFAFWAVREEKSREAGAADAPEAFLRSRENGVSNAEELARRNAERYGVSVELAHEYLTQHIDYSLDDSNILGMREFFRLAALVGALPKPPQLRFLY